jgi:hypothetical protein
MKANQAKQINQSLGQSPRFGPFSGQQFVMLAAGFSVVFGVFQLLLGLNIFVSLALSSWTGLTVAFLSGDRPHKFWSRVYPRVPCWTRGYAKYFSAQEKKKVGSKQVKVSRVKSKKLNPFEDWLDLTTLVRLQTDKRLIGAYLLSKKSLGQENALLQLVFGYSCTGFHPLFNSQQQVESFAQAFESGCKDIPQGERLTFRWSSFCDYSDTKEYLSKRLKYPSSKESEFLDYAQYAKVQQLSHERKRKNIKINAYATLTITEEDQTESGDIIDKGLSKVLKFFQKYFTSTGAKEITRKRIIKILTSAVEASVRYEQQLCSMGLSPRPKSEKELWTDLCQTIGTNPVRIPHTLVFNGRELTEEFVSGLEVSSVGDEKPLRHLLSSEAHMTSLLLNNGVPFADRRWVCLPTMGSNSLRFVGVLVLSRKPEIFATTADQIRFLWDIFSRDAIFDVEVLTEISPANRDLVRASQQMITRRSRTMDLNTQHRKSVDVSAQINVERSVEAQQKLFTGDIPENLSLVVLVYRNTPDEVDDACRTISGYINQPAELSREREYAWLIWLQTLLLRPEPILVAPYNRRLTFFASEVLGLTNVVQTALADNQGFELIADEGHSPVKIDFSKPKNVLIIGTTGSGKSVLAAPIIGECLALGMSVLIIDLPNDDGTGTFGDYTPYFGGFYFDISKESNNLVQPLDLRKILPEEIEDRVKAHRNDVILIVTQLVLGQQTSDADSFLTQTIESVIPLGIKAFYDDPQIQKRFAAARVGGLGSSSWEDTPTLADMERFFNKEHINLEYEDENVEQALNYIRLRLKYWQASSIGNAICKASTFDTDAKLITFALTNLQSAKDAEVFGMSAYIAASRQTLSSPNSVFFMDEASVLLRFNALSRLVGRKCATGRKAGSRVVIACQDVISVASSASGAQILQNMPCRLIGRIVPGAAQSVSDILGIPKNIIEKNEFFRPNTKEMYTLWLLDYNNKYIRCRYYPNHAVLALTANSREEQAARDSFKQKYSNKFEWVSEFSKYYIECTKQGKPL